MQDIRIAAHLAESLYSLLFNWDMGEGELVCYTTDNGRNTVAAEGELGWLSCFGHNFHLSITSGLASESRAAHVMGKCKSLVGMLICGWCKREPLQSQWKLNPPQLLLWCTHI